MTRGASALVKQLLSAPHRDIRDALAYELLEAMYHAENLEVLEPLYQSSDSDHARILVSILYDRTRSMDSSRARYMHRTCMHTLAPIR